MRVVGGVVSSDALRDGLLFALSPVLREGLEAAKPSVCCFIVVAEFERRAGADFGAFNGFEPEDVVMVEGKNELTGGASKSVLMSTDILGCTPRSSSYGLLAQLVRASC